MLFNSLLKVNMGQTFPLHAILNALVQGLDFYLTK